MSGIDALEELLVGALHEQLAAKLLRIVLAQASPAAAAAIRLGGCLDVYTQVASASWLRLNLFGADGLVTSVCVVGFTGPTVLRALDVLGWRFVAGELP